MSPQNHADCGDNYCTAILINTGRSLLAQFGLTPTDAGWLRVQFSDQSTTW